MQGRFNIGALVLRNDDTAIARVVQGLTLYLDSPHHWAREGAAHAFEVFLRRVHASSLAWFSTSMNVEWRRVDSAHGLQTLADALRGWSGAIAESARHGFFFEVGTEPRVPELGFYYREVDPRRTDRAAVIEISVPQTWPAGVIHDLAMELAQIGPFHCGIGGYQVRWDWRWKRHAHSQAYLWCGRFWGLDMQDSELWGTLATRSLPGTNWLTLIGRGLADRARFDLTTLARAPVDHGLTLMPFPHGIVVRAADVPDDGDVHRATYPESYAVVARALAPLFPEEPPELWGMFGGREHTLPWMRRFVDPKAWGERDLG